jgi:hypothetical protein
MITTKTIIKPVLIKKLKKFAKNNKDLIITIPNHRINITIQAFVSATIDAIDGDFACFNKYLGYPEETILDTVEYTDIIATFERIANCWL